MTESVQLPHQNCYDAIRRVAINKGVTDFVLEIDPGSSKGDNYLGEIFKVKIRGKKNSDDVIHLLLKAAPNGERGEIPVDIIYGREIVAYNEVLKTLRELQENSDVSTAVKFNFVNCYYASDEITKELLIFEDLKAQGFEMIGRENRVEIEHTNLVVQSLGKLHALSFVLQRRDPREFKRLQKKIPDLMKGLEFFKRIMSSSLDLAAKLLENPLHKEKVIQVKETYWESLKQSLEVDKYSVICHGDCWMNNVMFKSEDGKPVDVRFLDYQMMRYSSPVVDLFYFLFTSTDGKLRKAYYQNCLDLYYETLSAALKEYSYDCKEVFPKEEFNNQLKKSAKFGFLIGVTACKFVVPDVDVVDIASNEELAAPTEVAMDEYMRRLTDLIDDCMEYGYI